MSEFMYLFCFWMALLALQVFFPLLASVIKARFKVLGYAMHATPMRTLLRNSRFWEEARQQNRTYQDPKIAQLLRLHTMWWVVLLVTFFGLAAILGWTYV